MLKAFEYHSVHYLLKPLQNHGVAKAIEKITDLRKIYTNQALQTLLQEQRAEKSLKVRFIVRKGHEYIPIEVRDIAYFFTEHRLTFVQTFDNHTYMIDQSLSEIENQVDQNFFFRATRQHLINITAIEKYKSIEQSKIRVALKHNSRQIIIGKENAVNFRHWIS